MNIFSTLRNAFVLAVLLVVVAGSARAQTPTDSSRISYGEETLPAPLPASEPVAGSRLGQQYSKLVRLQIEETQLWKLGLNNIGAVYQGIANGPDSLLSSRLGVHLAYERKLTPVWSVLGEVSPDFLRYRDAETRQLRNGFAVRTQLAGRYYYNLNKRIRKGKSASNFSANYLSLALSSGFGRNSRETHYTTFARDGQAVRLSLAAVYGLQRRLGRYGFIDFSLAVPVALTPNPGRAATGALAVDIFGKLRIGLALGR
ncbi:hypothetical protein KBK19_12510 [Microvirga sp. STR05]|uniref:DUF3575 domain-containing protein n=1 Tax=Hymenobacter duratus TaxID=2771356 RepID=A0ABR8JM51_9BACT|nr:hypothetical protein [Hymenobacter duratus]MBD2715859.1 hypothetical protein [Hymenobacter duratus]MBR7950770.1 hypothetical protein [Microvirga sp. STR05]